MKTTIDWFKFRTKSDPFAILEALRPLFGTAGVPDMLTIKTGGKGHDGWKWSADLYIGGDIKVGMIDYGGDSQREWVRVNIPGEGCGWVQDWAAAELLEETLIDSEITRIDIALTTGHGEVTDSMVVSAHAAGKFTNGGRPPEMESWVSSNPKAGKTRYIGSRKYHKFMRCYEKGWELLKTLSETDRNLVSQPGCLMQVDVLGMVEPGNLYRVELELKNVDKYLPWTVIGRRDEVFAGSYPFCADLLPGVPHWHMQALPDFKPKAALSAGLANCKRSYGGILRALSMAGYSKDQIWDSILGDEPSQKMIDAGALTISV